MMVDQFLTVAEEINFVDTARPTLGLSPYEALIVASLAQAEAGKAEDFAKVARVAYNRAVKELIDCACLQFDVTANYWLEQAGKPEKASKRHDRRRAGRPEQPVQHRPSTPGLPVGPISNPGKAALEGAINPPVGNWLYFVAVDKNGTTKFASTDAEHGRTSTRPCRNGVGSSRPVLTCTSAGRRVLGKPIGHSLSPVIHNAGYAAAGPDRLELHARTSATRPSLAALVAGLGPEWAGLSLTMPLKEVALDVADEVAPAAAAIGAANTLVRLPDGTWRAENTDAPGMVDALLQAGVSTARAGLRPRRRRHRPGRAGAPPATSGPPR